jgi:hypothetical protein
VRHTGNRGLVATPLSVLKLNSGPEVKVANAILLKTSQSVPSNNRVVASLARTIIDVFLSQVFVLRLDKQITLFRIVKHFRLFFPPNSLEYGDYLNH